jgi:hypothetical protein
MRHFVRQHAHFVGGAAADFLEIHHVAADERGRPGFQPGPSGHDRLPVARVAEDEDVRAARGDAVAQIGQVGGDGGIELLAHARDAGGEHFLVVVQGEVVGLHMLPAEAGVVQDGQVGGRQSGAVHLGGGNIPGLLGVDARQDEQAGGQNQAAGATAKKGRGHGHVLGLGRERVHHSIDIGSGSEPSSP